MNLRDQLMAIYESHGKLTPAIVVDEARDMEHPLHQRFEWDDEIAGEKWRREQARELIQSVRVVYREATDRNPAKDIRAFHSVRVESDYVYEPAEKIAADPFLRRLVLNDMSREWMTLKRRFQDFDEFWKLVSEEAKEATG